MATRLHLPNPLTVPVGTLVDCLDDLQQLAFVVRGNVTEDKTISGADFISDTLDILRAHGLAPVQVEV